MNSNRLLPLGAAAGMIAVLAFAPAASGSTSSVAADPSDTAAGESCWVNVDNGESACFDAALDPVEQIEAATGTTVVAVPTGSGQPFAQHRAAVASDETSYLVATGWEEIGQTGASVSYISMIADVCVDTMHGWADLGAWNDRIESLRSYNGCETYLYDDYDFLGEEYGPIVSSDDLGDFRDRARSLWAE